MGERVIVVDRGGGRLALRAGRPTLVATLIRSLVHLARSLRRSSDRPEDVGSTGSTSGAEALASMKMKEALEPIRPRRSPDRPSGESILALLAESTGDDVEIVRTSTGELEASIPAESTRSRMRELRNHPDLGFEVLLDVSVLDRLGDDGPGAHRFEVIHQLYSPARKEWLRVRTRVESDANEVDSMTPLFESASWLEREAWDLYGIRFRGHPDLRRIFLADDFEGHPLRKDYVGDATSGGDSSPPFEKSSSSLTSGRVVVGPDHPVTRGALRFELDLDGEEIDELDCELGYQHCGLEKHWESLEWNEVTAWIEGMGAFDCVPASTAWCLAVEGLMGVEAPERSAWLRVLAAEHVRIASHLTTMARLDSQLGADAAASLALLARETILDSFEELSGARANSGYVVIGGVTRELPEGFGARWSARRPKLEKTLLEHAALSIRNRIYRDRLEGVARLSREAALAIGVTGPGLRACGEGLDLRRDAPHLAYPELDFEISIGSEGDDLDRLLVLREEVRQSLALIDQCLRGLEALGAGPISLPETTRAMSARGSASIGAGEIFRCVEAAQGILGFWVVSDGSAKPCRVHCRAPGLSNLQSLSTMMRSQQLADLGPTLALVNGIDSGFER